MCAANNNIGTRLTTAQMTGMDALSNMPGLSSVKWLVRASDEFYNYYPHLKGFAYDETAAAKDWPARKLKDGAMADAKAAAKTELENYKDPADYRADEQTDLAAAIADGEAAIDAAADIDAMNAALADAKATIDAIKTDAELTAEELAADKEAFEAYKTAKKADMDDLLQEGDSDTVQQIIADAASDIAILEYDENKTLDENKAAVDALANIADALAAQRAADVQAEADKAAADSVIALIDAIGTVEYTDESKAKIDDARAAYEALTEAQKGLVSNYNVLIATEGEYAALEAAAETPDESGETDEDVCPFCGEVHGTDVFEKIIKFIHYLYVFISLIINTFD